ncbi:glucose-1-phosphate adenylyltransferase [Agrococcus sp. TF02-05]|uniref:glucose-1-phosphate adenylyltransferase n=1 Tax=Agrococcus sp. TF02-05 TaxID=2815211 RepID=UPI001AA0E71C|nr:glucose-1-phosphate adenylyltransferase [Agrococcus sp. TF02-05]MBO1768736.1 glucose-1-phosphate adenylyltransferase [Agrococcus sp. TF02-05]
MDKKVFGIVLAGGEGKRLMPLTADRAKPAVPFGGAYRLIDFAISNLINSSLRQIVVLTQYKSHSLDRHISQVWRMSSMLNSYVTSVPAQQRTGKHWFAGSADAIFQSLNLIADEKPDIVVVVGADHVYRMDFRDMIDAHLASGARATVAGIRQPIELAHQFGVIEEDDDKPGYIRAFHEKPADASGFAVAPGEVLASMGNYVFDADALVEAVIADNRLEDSDHDMGGDIIPWFVERGEAAMYDLKNNTVPGATERDKYYWRDVGTIESFFDAHMDLISALPIFNLYNREWPIYTQTVNAPPAKFTRDAWGRAADVNEAIVGAGSVVQGASVVRSVVSPWCTIDAGATVSDAILFDQVHVGAGAVVRRAIIDKGVEIGPGVQIGVDHEADLARGFSISASGIVTVPKGSTIL